MKTNIILILFVFVLSASFGLPKGIQKRVDKELKNVFEVETFEMKAMQVDATIEEQLPLKIGENKLFRVSKGEKLLGYAFVDRAPSKTAEFDYLVIFDENLIIKRAKVLIYREEYGGEIGSKRWLKQFIGKSQTDTLEYQKNVSAISGATISVRSMTNAVNNVLKSIGILHENNVL
ncbi:FMN-binding protein [Leptobacterium flavescens]|uniref:FMN-binding protein n=1 Tax=Leptobacterium flavescens TaxID=472055 RepID=A0A6P0USL7_9FLAO|nr:FMN-binding protein [Leptobacterium flavescens]NER15530.1 FMN-binding protein [Leptobacterium flavescens]